MSDSNLEERPSLEEAARRASAPEDLLLPGEDPKSTYPDDARHWARVYAELVAFKDDLLSATEQHTAGMVAEARQEAQVDDVLLTHQRDRYRRRLKWWTSRAHEVDGKALQS